MAKPSPRTSVQRVTNTQVAQSRKHESAPTAEGPATPVLTAVFTNILCAVDGTRSSTAAVRLAACLAGPDGHLTLLAVTAASGYGPYATAAIDPSRVKDVLDRAKRVADDAGVQSTTVVDPGGPPVKVILERASHHDLLAIGAPVTSWLGGMLIGGVAVAALSQFTTPMLVARRSFTGSLRGRRILVASDGPGGLRSSRGAGR
jgi:nucleotide-binding universal stress UspA family protein